MAERCDRAQIVMWWDAGYPSGDGCVVLFLQYLVERSAERCAHPAPRVVRLGLPFIADCGGVPEDQAAPSRPVVLRAIQGLVLELPLCALRSRVKAPRYSTLALVALELAVCSEAQPLK